MRFTLFILICCIIASLCSCSKGWEDIQIPEQPKKVFIISKRFTAEWIYLRTVTQEIKGVDWQPYYNQKPDTLISTCSIDKRDSLFKIEIRSYDIR
jgi:hypothetical protein